MEITKEFLGCTDEQAIAVSKLNVPAHRTNIDPSFYEDFALRGIRVERVHNGVISCSFKVPPRLTDRDGKLAAGAIASIVDDVGAAAVPTERPRKSVSVDMSISYLSTANVDDELEIISRALGRRGGHLGTSVIIRNKASGEIIAEGRHSLFCINRSKI